MAKDDDLPDDDLSNDFWKSIAVPSDQIRLVGDSVWLDPARDVLKSTWDTLPPFGCCAIGEKAGQNLTTGSMVFLYGPYVGSSLTDECGLVIIALPNGRLFKADLKAETAEFMDYSDEAAMVSPEFRRVPS